MKRFILLFMLVFLQYSNAQWESAGWASDKFINAMTVCKGTIVFAQGEKLMASEDLGNSWQEIKKKKYPDAEFSYFAQNDNSILVASAFNGEVCLSSDCGFSWELISKGVVDGHRLLTIQISGDTIITGGYKNSKVYVSTNLGASWEDKSSLLFPSASGYNAVGVRSIAFLNDTVFVCIQSSNGAGLFKSIYLGGVWQKDDTQRDYPAEVFIFANKVYLYNRGIKISEDMGETWSPVVLKVGVETFASNGDRLYTGTDDGMYCSLDSGKNWIYYGLRGVRVESIGFLEDKIVASSKQAVYLLESPGEEWELLYKIVELGGLNKFAIKDDIIYAYEARTKILKSDDIGETWEVINLETKIKDVTAFEAINDKLFLATSSTDMKTGGLQVSTDNGKSWQPDLNLPKYVEEFTGKVNENLPVFAIISHGSYIFINTSLGVLHSTDNGETWSTHENNNPILPESGFASLGKELFFNTVPIISTTDYGETWLEKQSNGLPVGLENRSLFSFDNTLLVSSEIVYDDRSGIYLSRDRGENWDYITPKAFYSNRGYGTKRIFMSYAFDNYIFACTAFGVYVTLDKGEHWIAVKKGMEYDIVNDIKRIGDYVIIAYDPGFLRAKIRDISDLIVASIAEELPVIESAVYPNPTDAYLYFDKYDGAPLNYEIFDYAGTSVLSGTLDSYKIDVSELPAAAYIIVFSNNSQKRTMKFIKE